MAAVRGVANCDDVSLGRYSRCVASVLHCVVSFFGVPESNVLCYQPKHLHLCLSFSGCGHAMMMTVHLQASGRVPYYLNFWEYPIYSIAVLVSVTFFREIHFYWVHRSAIDCFLLPRQSRACVHFAVADIAAPPLHLTEPCILGST